MFHIGGRAARAPNGRAGIPDGQSASSRRAKELGVHDGPSRQRKAFEAGQWRACRGSRTASRGLCDGIRRRVSHTPRPLDRSGRGRHEAVRLLLPGNWLPAGDRARGPPVRLQQLRDLGIRFAAFPSDRRRPGRLPVVAEPRTCSVVRTAPKTLSGLPAPECLEGPLLSLHHPLVRVSCHVMRAIKRVDSRPLPLAARGAPDDREDDDREEDEDRLHVSSPSRRSSPRWRPAYGCPLRRCGTACSRSPGEPRPRP